MTRNEKLLAMYCAKQYGVSEDFVLNPLRKPEIVYPKKVMMYVLRKYGKMKLKDIMAVFGYTNHCTIIHHLQDVDGLLSYDEEFRLVIKNAMKFYKNVINGAEERSTELCAVAQEQG